GRFEERIADSDQIGIAELARSNLIRDGIFGGEAAFGERVNHASIALADGDDASRGRMRDATAANRGWRPDRVAHGRVKKRARLAGMAADTGWFRRRRASHRDQSESRDERRANHRSPKLYRTSRAQCPCSHRRMAA